MNLQAQDLMKSNFKVYFCNDSVSQIAKEMAITGDDLAFIKNLDGKLLGYCTIRNLLKGVLNSTNSINEVMSSDFTEALKSTEMNEEMFLNCEVIAVKNNQSEIIGCLTKKQFLEKRMRQELEVSKKYKQIFDAVHNGILAIDADGRICALNPAASKMAKTTEGRAIGKLLNDVVITKGLLKVMRTGEPHSEKYTAGKSKYLAHRTPIYDGKKLIGAVGVFQKLSEIETISEELHAVQDLEKDIHAIIDAIPEGVCILDQQGNIVRKNQTFTTKYINLLENIQYSTTFREAIAKVVTEKINYCVKIATMELRFTALENGNGELEKVICVIFSQGETDDLNRMFLKKNKLLEWTLKNDYTPKIVEKSKIAKSIVRRIKQVSQLDIPVCIIGEKGTDIRALCFDIVNKGSRKDKPTIEFNCKQYSPNKQEELLFGSGTDNKQVLGLLDCLDGGTLIIHRLEMMNIECQNKFLHFLKKQESDVRIIATMEGKLEGSMEIHETINEELYYLLNVSSIYLPNLSERKEDIDSLIDNYLLQLKQNYRKSIEITPEAKKMLGKKLWPGNELELFELLQKAYVLSSEKIDEDLLHIVQAQKDISSFAPILVRKVLPLRDAVDELEKQLILKVKETEKSYRKIAKILDVDASTIARKIKKLEIADIEEHVLN